MNVDEAGSALRRYVELSEGLLQRTWWAPPELWERKLVRGDGKTCWLRGEIAYPESCAESWCRRGRLALALGVERLEGSTALLESVAVFAEFSIPLPR